MSQANSEQHIGELLADRNPPEAVADSVINDHERQQELQRRAANLQTFIASRGERYADCKLSTYDCEYEKQREVVKALREYGCAIHENVKGGLGIVAFGPKGTGKDHLLSAMAVHAIRAGHNVMWVNGAELFGEFRDNIGDQRRTEAAIVRSYVTPAILYLSDPLPPMGSVTEFQATTLFRILDARYSRRKPTWCSVNVNDGTELEQRLGPQNADRLRDGALALYCSWPSYRKVRQ